MIFGNHQQNTLDQFAEYRKTATKSALLGDAHSINVLETLKPIIVVMAGANDEDHYHIEG